MNNLQYRSDIDGLRALSVMAVLFYHANYPWAGGGFVGVDVFFVISGYLISNKILADLEAKTFSFRTFYIRRIRRLFPALFATIFLTFIAAAFLFTPADLERVANSSIFSTLSIANIFFLSESGYFDPRATSKPLLHLWSLSVEEQFYLVWPLFLLIVFKIKRKVSIVSTLIFLTFFSVVLTAYWVEKSPESTFFLAHFRAFEFLLGALVVQIPTPSKQNPLLREILLFSGLSAILWSVFFFSKKSIHPGMLTLVPCVGAALTIYAGKSKYFGAILRFKPLVKVGLMSYSIYLLHWPVMVFYDYWYFTPLTFSEQSALKFVSSILIVVSIMLGALMWKFVELPFRKGCVGISGKLVFPRWTYVSVISLTVIGSITIAEKGFPQRYSAEVTLTQDQIQSELDRYYGDDSKDIVSKSYFIDDTYKNVVVMGDSHGIGLITALQENGAKANYNFLGSSFKCFNFGASAVESSDFLTCQNRLAKNLSDTVWAEVDEVYLYDHWGGVDLVVLDSLLNDIRRQTDAHIVVFGPQMRFSEEVPNLAFKNRRAESLNEYAQQYELKYKYLVDETVGKKLNSIHYREKNIYYVSTLSVLCGDKKYCEILSEEDMLLLYFDTNHFTMRGAQVFGKKLKEIYPVLFL